MENAPKVSDDICFSPKLSISPISQNEKWSSLISICVAASGDQSQHKKDNIYHNSNSLMSAMLQTQREW